MPEECSCIFTLPPPAVPTASSPQCDLSIWLYIGNRLAVGGGDKEKKRMQMKKHRASKATAETKAAHNAHMRNYRARKASPN